MDANEGNFAKILEAVNNNLNSAEACAIIDNSVLTLNDWRMIDELFGLRLIEDTPDVSSEVYDLISERDKARAEKNFEKSDKIRDELLKQNIALKDNPEGATWYYND